MTHPRMHTQPAGRSTADVPSEVEQKIGTAMINDAPSGTNRSDIIVILLIWRTIRKVLLLYRKAYCILVYDVRVC